MTIIENLSLESKRKVLHYISDWEHQEIDILDKDFLARSLNSSIINNKPTSYFGDGSVFQPYLLYGAIAQGDIDLVRDLCKNGAKVNLYCYNNLDNYPLENYPLANNKSPLQLCADYGDFEIAKVLLNEGANASSVISNYSDNLGKNPVTFVWSSLQKYRGRNVQFVETVEYINKSRKKIK